MEELAEEYNMVVINTGQGTRLNNNGSNSQTEICLVSGNLSLKCSWKTIDGDEWGSDHLTHHDHSKWEATRRRNRDN